MSIIWADGGIGGSPGCLACGPGVVACSVGCVGSGGVGWSREGISRPWEGPFLQRQQAPGSKPEKQEQRAGAGRDQGRGPGLEALSLCSPAAAGPRWKGRFAPNPCLVFPWPFFRSGGHREGGSGCQNSFDRMRWTLLTSAPDCWVIDEKSPRFTYQSALGKNFPETQLIFPLLCLFLH